MNSIAALALLLALQSPPPPTSSSSPPSPGLCGTLVPSDAWIRLVPPGAKNTAAFLRVRNPGDVDVVIVGATSPIAKRAELHTHQHEGGVMKMQAVPSVVVPARGEARFAPGGLHVMLFEQTGGMKEAEHRPLTLRCDDGSAVVVEAVVASAAPPSLVPPSSVPPSSAPPSSVPPSAPPSR
jgi:hypothetical protein